MSENEDLRKVEPGGEYEPLSDPSGEHVESVVLDGVPPDAAEPDGGEPNEPWRIAVDGEPGADQVEAAEHEDPEASSDATEPEDEDESEVPF